MAFLISSNSSLFFKNPNTPLSLSPIRPHSLSSPLFLKSTLKSSFIRFSTFSTGLPDPPSGKTAQDKSADGKPDGKPTAFVDEWGEKAEPETERPTKFSDADPTKDDDEWTGVSSGDEYVAAGNGIAPADLLEDKNADLKRCLVDTFYGTELGFRASAEDRAEIMELVTQLEAANPTPAPTGALELLNGNWILLYTASSELLPLLAAGSTPFLKVDKICQSINTTNLIIDNSITLSGPVATFTFAATASFEVQTPSKIQVEFKEGTLKPPEIKSNVNLPENLEIFGQTINLSSVQQSLNPLEEGLASIARVISGQPPVKVPIPGESTKSWLLITYLDKDLRISRGDGGLFVLAKEGSPLLAQ